MPTPLTMSQRRVFDAALELFARAESESASVAFARIRSGVLELAPQIEHADSDAMSWLESVWPDFLQRCYADAYRRYAQIKERWLDAENDPFNMSEDLLTPIGCERDETIHTQVLAHLLHPRRTHGLGSAFLAELIGRCGIPVAGLRMDDARVIAERSATLSNTSGSGGRSRPRTDLWVEIPGPDCGLLVVIENKVDADEGDGQLADYDSIVNTRLAHLGSGWSGRCVLLTPHGAVPSDKRWLRLSYFQLAVALRRAMPSPGRHPYAALYLSTILREIVGLPRRGAARTAMLVEYLDGFLAETPA